MLKPTMKPFISYFPASLYPVLQKIGGKRVIPRPQFYFCTTTHVLPMAGDQPLTLCYDTEWDVQLRCPVHVTIFVWCSQYVHYISCVTRANLKGRIKVLGNSEKRKRHKLLTKPWTKPKSLKDFLSDLSFPRHRVRERMTDKKRWRFVAALLY